MARRSCHGLQSPVILYQTGHGISPSLLNAEETSLPTDQTSCGPIYWNWRVSLKRISALTPRSVSCRGCSQLAHRSSSSDSLTTQLSFAFYSVNQSSNSFCPWNVLRVSGCESTLCCEARGPRVKTLQLLMAERIHHYFFPGLFGLLQTEDFLFKFWPDKVTLRVVYQKGIFSGGIYFAVTGRCHCMPSQIHLERLICYKPKHLFLLP